METVGCFHGSCGSLHGSGEGFHRFRGYFHSHGSWMFPWRLPVEAPVEVRNGRFHGSFSRSVCTSTDFRELPLIIVYFHTLQTVSGSSHYVHRVHRHFHGGHFCGSTRTLPIKSSTEGSTAGLMGMEAPADTSCGSFQ